MMRRADRMRTEGKAPDAIRRRTVRAETASRAAAVSRSSRWGASIVDQKGMSSSKSPAAGGGGGAWRRCCGAACGWL